MAYLITFFLVFAFTILVDTQWIDPYPYNGTTCVTYPQLRYYNYSDLFNNLKNSANIFPENYCYGLLTYNITVEKFNNIINLNLGIISYYYFRCF